MDIKVAEARNQFTKLLRAVEHGESIVITRNGKPVAQLAPPPAARKTVVLGAMKDTIKLLPGWDKPVDPDAFLLGEI